MPNPAPTSISPAERSRLIARAVREGRHAEEWKILCDQCREWVNGIYAVVPGSRKKLCFACAIKQGLGPKEPSRVAG